MEFFGELLQYSVSYIILIALAIAGVFAGMALRKRKNEKAAGEEN